MASPKAALQEIVGRFVFRSAVVGRAENVGRRFRRLTLGGSELRGVSWTPGDKLQVFLPGIGTRTYTPVRWDAEAGETEILAYLHGEGPGAEWAGAVEPGAAVRFFGPRGSLVVGGHEPTVIVGDETSLGLALATGAGGQAILEATDPAEVEVALDALGFAGVRLVERRSDEGHVEALADMMNAALQSRPGARLVLSGRAAAIQGIRRALKARGTSLGNAKAKAYWAPGKKGLD